MQATPPNCSVSIQATNVKSSMTAKVIPYSNFLCYALLVARTLTGTQISNTSSWITKYTIQSIKYSNMWPQIPNTVNANLRRVVARFFFRLNMYWLEKSVWTAFGQYSRSIDHLWAPWWTVLIVIEATPEPNEPLPWLLQKQQHLARLDLFSFPSFVVVFVSGSFWICQKVARHKCTEYCP